MPETFEGWSREALLRELDEYAEAIDGLETLRREIVANQGRGIEAVRERLARVRREIARRAATAEGGS